MPEEEQSLITDEMRALIGVRGEPRTVVVREEDARRVRDVLGDSDPRYRDETGVAPPYVLSMLGGGQRMSGMPRVLPGGLMTQQEWRFFRPFVIGEALTAYQSVVDIRERLGGRYGHSVLVTMGIDYHNGGGDLVASFFETLTQFDPNAARKGE
ncbi:MAG: MaoC family dehydratase N-terminal domain-containing protein [Dehalococcoidia bacterium]|nr:MaoC family dehydratase N-terminal domain-containing protein [Dehalococcoidia bacterium]